ncbi:MAG: DinB family protein [Bacteroidia bacterium]|nr:DinB family protein [Bacteroidia bacterium]
MNEIERVVANAADCFDGKPWYGTSTMSIIDMVSYSQVNIRPEGFSKSIAGLLRHMIAWRVFTIKRLRGLAEFTIDSKSAENWNSSNVTEKEWKGLLKLLKKTQEALVDAFENLQSENLTQGVPGSIYNMDYLIRGIIQHDVYHLGQIAVLKDIIES